LVQFASTPAGSSLTGTLRSAHTTLRVLHAMTQRNTGVPWRAVCNIETATGVIGSGGLVDGTCVGMPESCILTAHFVLPSADVAATATVRFSLHDEDYPECLEATLSPDDGFISLCNADMDFSLVACCPNAAHTKYLSKPGRPWQANERVELPAEFGLPAAMPMGVAPGAHLLPGAGGRVRIWHHPHGAFQQPPSDATAVHYCRRTITTYLRGQLGERAGGGVREPRHAHGGARGAALQRRPRSGGRALRAALQPGCTTRGLRHTSRRYSGLDPGRAGAGAAVGRGGGAAAAVHLHLKGHHSTVCVVCATPSLNCDTLRGIVVSARGYGCHPLVLHIGMCSLSDHI
jgi:hypothetical protein